MYRRNQYAPSAAPGSEYSRQDPRDQNTAVDGRGKQVPERRGAGCSSQMLRTAGPGDLDRYGYQKNALEAACDRSAEARDTVLPGPCAECEHSSARNYF